MIVVIVLFSGGFVLFCSVLTGPVYPSQPGTKIVALAYLELELAAILQNVRIRGMAPGQYFILELNKDKFRGRMGEFIKLDFICQKQHIQMLLKVLLFALCRHPMVTTNKRNKKCRIYVIWENLLWSMSEETATEGIAGMERKEIRGNCSL